ncbi:hypothetical protein DNI29_13955 [Hymenobacter sediminis]|uniref:hypothetical protein n=1 Tax=Hymenobacter sediminis TaxID=2218621 RepID=UPI000DA6AD48|nr:hypothetical protein [Hymenobacter sediminis]RPD46111.1 hypothetical protein DNI29_13955 [Hymenobacter sediminis]
MTTSSPIRYAPRWVAWVFFGLLLTLGCSIFADYGVSWDEPADRRNGLVNLRFLAELLAPSWAARQPLLQQAPPLFGYTDNDHGVLFEIPMALYDVLRPSTDARSYYLARHFCIFLICFSGTWALYRIALLRFRNEYLGLLTAALLVLSPRLFADSFYNAKDLVFLALFTVGIYTLLRLLARPTLLRAIVHGLVTAAVIDVRVPGVLLIPFTFTLLLLQTPDLSTSSVRRRLISLASVYLLTSLVIMVAGWPYLWAHPLTHFRTAFGSMKSYSFMGNVLYLGKLEPARHLPWHYIPVWLLLTTPIAYSVAAIVGVMMVGATLARKPLQILQSSTLRLDVLFSGWFLLPIILVIFFNSALYDGWRHLYFVYPGLLLLAVRGGWGLWQWGRGRGIAHAVVVAAVAMAGLEGIYTAARMIAMHPHQQAFFSFLPAQHAERLFERDYWGLSFRQGLEQLVRHQPTGPIYLDTPSPPPYENNKIWLRPADQKRLIMAAPAPGHYHLNVYRTVSPEAHDTIPGQEALTVRANGIKILSVLRRQ